MRLRLVLSGIAIRRLNTVISKQLPPISRQIARVPLLPPPGQGAAASAPAGSAGETYSALFESARLAVASLAAAGDGRLLSSYSSILECILRLRQACCDPRLVPPERIQVAKALVNEHRAKQEERASKGGAAKKAKIAKPAMSADEAIQLLERLRGLLTEADGAPDGESAGASAGATEAEGGESGWECCVCLEEVGSDAVAILRTCKHAFCAECVSAVAQRAGKKGAACPLCRAAYGQEDVMKHAEILQAAAQGKSAAKAKAAETRGWGSVATSVACPAASAADLASSSPKIHALLGLLAAQPSGDKAIVFSQFTGFLALIGSELRARGIPFASITGGMTPAARAAASRAFMVPSPWAGSSSGELEPVVLLASLKAAGQGLNLVGANHCYLMDPWWNAAAEEQAAARVHRLGQVKPVTVTKLLCEGSIEERIIQLQERKAALSRGAMQKLSEAELRKTRAQSLKDLFEL